MRPPLGFLVGATALDATVGFVGDIYDTTRPSCRASLLQFPANIQDPVTMDTNFGCLGVGAHIGLLEGDLAREL
ncbi:hypothetical protein B0I37DRAFT_384085 [Chaetomium sp. MPI-CAGE-AT-0009]|nr:hypothetical protein B0I37DRAFT_384085 [Chaetomium sp. MPI-CAGE-AT-0009]